MARVTHVPDSPHDRFFRSYFQRADILQSLAEFVLPSDLCRELDFSRLSLDVDTHVEHEQSTRYSDLSATVGYGSATAKLYLLFEHKSWPDPWVSLQLLRYQTRIWSRHEREKHRPPLPPIIPIVIYHGVSRHARTDFEELFAEDLSADLRAYCASFRVETLNLTALGAESMPLAPPALAAGLVARGLAARPCGRGWSLEDSLLAHAAGAGRSKTRCSPMRPGLWVLKNARAGIRELLAPIDRLAQRWGWSLEDSLLAHAAGAGRSKTRCSPMRPGAAIGR